MKLKNIVLASVAAGSLLAGSAVLADGSGLTLSNISSVPSANIYVSCNNAPAVQGQFNAQVPWGIVKAIFLGGASSGTCQFTEGKGPSATKLGHGTISITGSVGSYQATVQGYSDNPSIAVDPSTPVGPQAAITITLKNAS